MWLVDRVKAILARKPVQSAESAEVKQRLDTLEERLAARRRQLDERVAVQQAGQK